MTSNHDNKLSLSELKSLAEQGDMQAQFALGLYYLQSVEWEFIENLRANCLLASLSTEKSGEFDRYRYIDHVLELPKDNNKTNDKLAFDWFHRAAKQGYAESQYALAHCYFEEKGIEKNDKLAFEWAKKSAEHGISYAFCLLGDLYHDGRGVEKEDKLALECYKKADKAGVKNVRSKIQHMLLTGKGIENYDERREAVINLIDDFSGLLRKESNHLVDILEKECPPKENDEDPVADFLNLLDKNTNYLTGLLKASSLTAIDNDESSKKLKQKLYETNKELVASKGRLQKMVQQFTHALGNVIFPDIIYQVSERLKKTSTDPKDILLLTEAYHSEKLIKLLGELLRLRYANSNPEHFRQTIRSCRLSIGTGNTKSIVDVLDYALSRVIARFLNQDYAGLKEIREQIIEIKGTNLEVLKHRFEDNILLNDSASTLEWANLNLLPIIVTEISPLWKKIFSHAESYTEALLFSYFSEVLFNAFKYSNHDHGEFLTISFNECIIDSQVYLSCNFSNPSKDSNRSSLGSGEGLDAIKEDLYQLNDTDQAKNSLMVSKQEGEFQVTLFFQKDLLYFEPLSEHDYNMFL